MQLRGRDATKRRDVTKLQANKREGWSPAIALISFTRTSRSTSSAHSFFVRTNKLSCNVSLIAQCKKFRKEAWSVRIKKISLPYANFWSLPAKHP